MSAVDCAQGPIEGAERTVAGFPSHLHHEAIREANGRSSAKLPNCRGNRIGILDRQMLMTQQHLNRRRDGRRATIVDGRQHPRRFGQGQLRHPGPRNDKILCSSHLLCVISRDQANEDVGVNGSQAAS